MASSSRPYRVLVTGATGNVGLEVVRSLLSPPATAPVLAPSASPPPLAGVPTAARPLIVVAAARNPERAATSLARDLAAPVVTAGGGASPPTIPPRLHLVRFDFTDATTFVAAVRSAAAAMPDSPAILPPPPAPAAGEAAAAGASTAGEGSDGHALDALFLMRPPELTDVDRQFKPLIDAAVAAGVKHIVFLSVMGAGTNTRIPHHGIELAINACAAKGVTHTHLRAGFFSQNMAAPHHAPDIRDHNQVYVPAGSGRTSFIDTRDIGAVAAVAILNPAAYTGGDAALVLTGDEAITYSEVAAILSRVTGRTITYPAPWAVSFTARMRSRGLAWGFIGVMIIIYSVCYYGYAGDVTPTTREVLGRPPIPFAQFAEENKAVWMPAALPPAATAGGAGGAK